MLTEKVMTTASGIYRAQVCKALAPTGETYLSGHRSRYLLRRNSRPHCLVLVREASPIFSVAAGEYTYVGELLLCLSP